MPESYNGPVSEILVQGPKIYREFPMASWDNVPHGAMVAYYPGSNLAGHATPFDGIVIGCAERVADGKVRAKTGAYRLRNAEGSRAVGGFDMNRLCCVVDEKTVGSDDGVTTIAGRVLYLDGDFVVVLVGLEAGRENRS